MKKFLLLLIAILFCSIGCEEKWSKEDLKLFDEWCVTEISKNNGICDCLKERVINKFSGFEELNNNINNGWDDLKAGYECAKELNLEGEIMDRPGEDAGFI